MKGALPLSAFMILIMGYTAWTDASEGIPSAEFFIHESGFSGGVCVVIEGDPDLVTGLGRYERFVVQALYGDKRSVEVLRKSLREKGLYGRVSADLIGDSHRLPYAENLINIFIVPDFDFKSLSRRGPGVGEIYRVLRPLGIAFLGVRSDVEEFKLALEKAGFQEIKTIERFGTWVSARKAWPKEIDEWTHYTHGPDGNSVAQDGVVGPPKHLQWISEPLWLRDHDTDSSVMAVVTARGRLFYIEDKGPIGVVGNHPLPDNWFLVARDAFNGILLWEIPIKRWGWREWKDGWFCRRPWNIPLNIHRRLVATGKRVYVTLGYHAPVSELDAATGKVLRTFEGTEDTREILYCRGRLILTVKRPEGLKLLAIEAESGQKLWEAGPFKGSRMEYAMKVGFKRLDPVLNPVTDGESICLLDGDEIVCLDFNTGRGRWRSKPSGEGELWVGSLILHDGTALYAEPEKICSISLDRGRLLWSRPLPNLGWLWFQWKDVFVVDGLVWVWSHDIGRREKGGRGVRVYPLYLDALYPTTGKLVRRVSLGGIFNTIHHHRCYRNRATLRYIIASRRGAEFISLKGEPHVINNWVRGTCHFGMLPANGLLYAPPHPCVCYRKEKLMGFNALAPEIPARYRRGTEGTRLERGPAYGSSPLAEDGDGWWPTFLHDAMRTLCSDEEVPPKVKMAWSVELGEKLSPPVVADGMVFVSEVDRHVVSAFDYRTGKQIWEFTTGGRVRVAPTYWRGFLLFGCADGWIYCLRAGDGKLVWRFRAAPQERRIVAFGQLESAWPVESGVLVQNGLAYAVAGRSSHLDGGLFIYALDPMTGNLIHRRVISGPELTTENVRDNIKPPQGLLADLLEGDGRFIYIRHIRLSPDLQRLAEGGRMRTRGVSTFLDDTYFKRAPWFYGLMTNWGRIVAVRPGKAIFAVRMFKTLKCLDPKNYFTPGQGYTLLSKSPGRVKMEGFWRVKVPIRVRALLVTGDIVWICGPPDAMLPTDPLGTFEGRAKGMLWALSAETGEKLAEYTLERPALFNGMAAVEGKLYIATVDGKLVSMEAAGY